MNTDDIPMMERLERGKNIRNARRHMNMTQKQLAEKLGLATGTIQQYELGKREPSLSTIEAIASALSVSPIQLFQTSCGTKETIDMAIQLQDNESKKRLDDSFLRLNVLGKAVAADRVEELTEIPRYRRQDAPQPTPPASGGTDTAPPSDAPERPQEGKE